jgi:hypothetical protein
MHVGKALKIEALPVHLDAFCRMLKTPPSKYSPFGWFSSPIFPLWAD